MPTYEEVISRPRCPHCEYYPEQPHSPAECAALLASDWEKAVAELERVEAGCVAFIKAHPDDPAVEALRAQIDAHE